jgi:phosphoribosyl 1,2-cyclic phosphodiesterase
MRFASLGSGSEGNALVVAAGTTRLMVDCGFPVEETERRLARIGLAPTDIAGIVVTHEHSDHSDGCLPFARRHRVRVWMTYGTARALQANVPPPYGNTASLPFEEEPDVIAFDSHTPFAVGDIEVRPFPVPHDAREPVQLVITDGAVRLGVLTDTGTPTRHIQAMLSGCDGLFLECNHDPRMLADGPYPAWLKSRIAGPFGHLANESAAMLLAAINRTKLRAVIAAHLSRTNNIPRLATAALATALGCAQEEIGVADQKNGIGWQALR